MSLQSALVIDILAFVFALALCSTLTPAVRRFAVSHRFLDLVGSVRKVHTQAVPRLGGVAIFIAWLAAGAALLAVDPALREQFWMRWPRSGVFLAGAAAAAALGMADDLYGLRARYKLVAQFAIGAALCAAGFTVHEIQLPGSTVVSLGIFAVPLTMLWIAGMMNAMNLIDGLDGLAGGVAGIALSAMVVLALLMGKPLFGMHSAALLGAVLGFLVYNFSPASIFMGDAGSLFLGYFLSVAVLVPAQGSSPTAMKLAMPLVILAVPIADTALAIARRLLRGLGIFSPDREHLHHRLLARGMSQREAVITLYGVCVVLAASGLVMHLGGPYMEIIVFGAIVCAAISALRLLGFLDFRLKTLRSDRARNTQIRTAFRAIATRLHHARDVDDVIASIGDLAPAVSASAVRARIGNISMLHGTAVNDGEGIRMQFAVNEGTYRLGDVEVLWREGSTPITIHTLAIEELCEDVARTVRRVAPELAPRPARAALAGLEAMRRGPIRR